MIDGMAHVCIGATDLEATERFYCEGLGCEKVFDFIREGEVVGFYLRIADANFVEVFLQEEIDAEAPAPISHLCLEVSDIDGVAERLASKGYEVTEKKLGADRSWQVWTSDPCGVRIEFHQYTGDSSQVTGADCRLD